MNDQNTFIKDVALKNVSALNICAKETDDVEVARLIHGALLNSAHKLAERFGFHSAKREKRLPDNSQNRRNHSANVLK